MVFSGSLQHNLTCWIKPRVDVRAMKGMLPFARLYVHLTPIPEIGDADRVSRAAGPSLTSSTSNWRSRPEAAPAGGRLALGCRRGHVYGGNVCVVLSIRLAAIAVCGGMSL